VAELIAAWGGCAARFAAAHTTPFDGPLAAAAEWTDANAPASQMMSGLAEARLLQALIACAGASLVLEIGTFTAVGALAMAAAVPEGGRVITLEYDPDHAAIARRHIAASAHRDRIELIEGDALELLPKLQGPFDLVYIDAWKSDYPAYYELVLPKLSARGAIVADNMFRYGAVLDPAIDDAQTRGIREFVARVQADERVDNVLLTVGDGLMLAWPRVSRGG
jgi:caffeoyl-CoA O-methyltransferase